MWDRRIDNKKKLKLNVVLTIFGYFIKEKTFKDSTEKYLENLSGKELHDIQNNNRNEKNQNEVNMGYIWEWNK